jgi:hypothetical protein
VEIPLAKNSKKYVGQYAAIVDDVDYEVMSASNWYIKFASRTQYAKRTWYHDGSRIIQYMHIAIYERRIGHSLAKDEWVDHKDGNGLNNVFSNLRLATRAENAANRRINKDNTSGAKGVSWHKKDKRWRVTVAKKHIGNFLELEDAIKARRVAAIEYYGEYVNHENP